jgi:hypothetical protein
VIHHQHDSVLRHSPPAHLAPPVCPPQHSRPHPDIDPTLKNRLLALALQDINPLFAGLALFKNVPLPQISPPPVKLRLFICRQVQLGTDLARS